MLRRWTLTALVVVLLSRVTAPGPVRAQAPAAPSSLDDANAPPPAELEMPPEILPEGSPSQPEEPLPPEGSFQGPPPQDDLDDSDRRAETPQTSHSFFSNLKWLGLRHSSTNGRSAGLGIPLVSTSWLNRPYYFGGDIGTVWITRPVNNHITNDTDMFGGVFGGCDWDYYWGTELAVHRATPELINETVRTADRGDRLMEWTASMMYYPWGDALFRPYWRCGIGATQIDYPADGHRRDEDLWTFPIGVGLKYPVRRWLVARAEFADQLALGNHGVATQHDLTLTFGLEWRFGAHPRSYWPWNPSRHIW